MTDNEMTNYEKWLGLSKSEMIAIIISDARTYVGLCMQIASLITDASENQVIKFGRDWTLIEAMNALANKGQQLLDTLDAAAVAVYKTDEEQQSDQAE